MYAQTATPPPASGNVRGTASAATLISLMTVLTVTALACAAGMDHVRTSEVPLCRALSCVALGPADLVYGWEYHSLISSCDHGETWQTIRTFPDSVGCRGLFINSAGSVFLGLTRTGSLCAGHPGTPWVWDEPLVYECSACSPNTNNSAMWKMCEDADANLYVGEYGGAWSDTCAFIHRSHDGGLTWTTVYEGTGRHIHFVRYDPWQDALYAGMGDGVGRQQVLRSLDAGASWQSLSISGCLAQPTDVAFTATHRIFGSDCGDAENCIYRTSDDETFETVLLLDGLRDAYIWDMAGDTEDFIIAGTRAKLVGGSAVALYTSGDGGATWTVLKELGVQPQWSGVSDITKLDSENHAYYTCWDPTSGCCSYRLTLDPSSGVAPGCGPRDRISISCASPCSGTAVMLVHAMDDVEHADITVHNVTGRQVASLLSAPIPAGTTSIRWDGLGSGEPPMPSGVYFVRLTADSVTAHSVFVLVR